MASKPLKIFIYPCDGAGHINATVGVAQALVERGHKIFLLLNSAFEAQYLPFGFEQILLKKSEKPVEQTDSKQNPFKVHVEMVKQMGMLSNKSPLEKAKLMSDPNSIKPFFNLLAEFEPQVEEAIKREQPDLIILDNVLIQPAILKSKIPWMVIMSGNPLILHRSKDLPPATSGYSAYDKDRTKWVEFQTESLFGQPILNHQIKINEMFGLNNTTDIYHNGVQYYPESPYLNIYGYPEELDYLDIVTLPDNVARIDAFCRTTPEPFEIPSELNYDSSKDKLIYVSLGSMGSIDVDLMKSIVSILGKTEHKYIVSKGPLHDEYELPSNCWGKAYLPQTNILKHVDLVITHGGNNTTTETFCNGVPMIVMPLFGDQFDNAQRLDELGLGCRMEPYDLNEKQLIDSINRLLNDNELKEKLQRAAKRIKESNGKQLLCERIEKIVYETKAKK
ncbi:hypothetical protein RDWZM_006547 [Blomia tropicalis]|uniref:UDP-glycosyltransferase n=1 Tax=Blomia tropicalis TaxID=40697 RepID=A0A9Q0RNP3_BLOTA|nr:hypothetical protein RDWZM_006547 [Blomia tropicalis]